MTKPLYQLGRISNIARVTLVPNRANIQHTLFNNARGIILPDAYKNTVRVKTKDCDILFIIHTSYTQISRHQS